MTWEGGREHILEIGDHNLKDRLWAGVRREDTENVKISTSTEPGNTDSRDRGSMKMENHGGTRKKAKRN